MKSARKYAEVAIRKAWADLLLKLRLRDRSAEAYDEALVRAFVLALDFEPAGVTSRPPRPVAFACEHMSITASGCSNATCWHAGCRMRPIYAEQMNRAVA